MKQKNALYTYILHLGDNAVINGHRLSEWCANAPSLELDVALANCSLDYIGQARSLFDYAAQIEGKGRTEDDIAYLRDENEYLNLLLLEQPNTDFGYTIARMFFYSLFARLYFEQLKDSQDTTLSAIAEKSLKELQYHNRFSGEWLIRLGDGTEESHQKAQQAVNDLWMYTGEMFSLNKDELLLLDVGISVDNREIREAWLEQVQEVIHRATLTLPDNNWMQSGGKEGLHSEHMGYILSDMQYLQRRYPGAQW